MEIIVLILAIIFWSIYYIFQVRYDVTFIKEVGSLVNKIELKNIEISNNKLLLRKSMEILG